MSSATPPLQVHVDDVGGGTLVGVAYVSERRRTTSTVFRYDLDFMGRGDSYGVSPDLDLSSGTHHVFGLPGAFRDCSPDRWGRNLIARHQRAVDTAAGTTPRTLGELDYLLGVSDLTRQGALRFRQLPEPAFLAVTEQVPPLVELPRLLRAADMVAAGDDALAPVKELLDAGTGSLGGARPKASVRDGERLLIAKFPHPDDGWDVMAWEMVLLDLAERAGINVPARRLVMVGERRSLLLERFDRVGGRRRAYVSAMTLVGGTDGGSYDYLEVAERLSDVGASVAADLEALSRRIAFGLAVHDTDDHLRNHGFLRAGVGWTLSPMFDVNPDSDPSARHATSIAYAETRSDAREALRSSGGEFGLTGARLKVIEADVADAVAGWRAVATRYDISRSEQDLFSEVLSPRR